MIDDAFEYLGRMAPAEQGGIARDDHGAAAEILYPQAQLGKLPQIPFPLGAEPGPIFEPFAKIGLLFTSNLARVRQAYRKAGAAEGFWEPVEA